MSGNGSGGSSGMSAFVFGSGVAPPQPQPQRCHPDFSFADADVILVSDDTEFRVHKYQLCRNSPKFSAMLAGKIGFPIRLLPLSHPKNDFAKFLNMLYNNLTIQDYLKPDLPLVRLMVRLCKFYQVKPYEQLGLTHLNRLAPSGISDWLDYNNPTLLSRLQASDNVACISDFNWTRDCVTVAYLAREVRLPRLFNTALYHYAQLLTPDYIFDSDPHEMLPQPDHMACYKGRDKLRLADYRLFRDMYARVPVPHCETEAVCKAARRRSKYALESGQADDWVTTGPLTGRQDEWLRQRELSLCAPCRASVKGELAFGRQKILDRLGTYFEHRDGSTSERRQISWTS